MQFMGTIIRKSGVPDDCGIFIEYKIPATCKRIDFIIAGHDDNEVSNFVIVELKQWEEAEATEKEDIVRTYVGGSDKEVLHPSYQAYSYKKYLSDMNQSIYDGQVFPISCAYLHNYHPHTPDPLLSEQYQGIIRDTPIFFSSDTEKLEDFINRYVRKGRGNEILYQIEHGKIAPSKKFVEYVSELFEGNKVFTLLDEQKIAYANIIDIAAHARKKTTIIVDGGPGTGKSVVAMNAFVTLLKQGRNLKFIAPNAAFRSCIEEMLAQKSSFSKKRLSVLFSGSSAFVDAKSDEFDVLICDEAHRLKGKGAFMYSGISQVEDIINASRINVFFIDDHQNIRPEDEGSVKRIKAVARKHGSSVMQVGLKAQFRCSGAEGFINWIDNTLQIAETANYDGWDKQSFSFELCDDPNLLYQKIKERVSQGANARMLAGFAWEWTSEKQGNTDAQVCDVSMDEYNFRMPWNSHKDSTSWAINNKIDQIGCVHTAQGLEFDYVGVLIGNDLRFDPQSMKVYASRDDYHDAAGKKGLKDSPDKLTVLIKNIYKILLSRGMKGCYVFCRDKNLQEHLRNRMMNMSRY